MRPEELMAMPPEQLAAMSDSELSNLLAPLFPVVRAEYCGPREKDAIRLPNGQKVSMASVQRDAATLQRLIAAAGGKVPSPNPIGQPPAIVD